MNVNVKLVLDQSATVSIESSSSILPWLQEITKNGARTKALSECIVHEL